MTFPETLTLEELLEDASKFYHHCDTVFANRLFNYFNFNKRQLHHHLSKGQQSTFNMIVGLASRSPLTIFDEPTTGMDSAARKDFYRALLKDYLAYPRTIILSSHHLDEIEGLLEDVLLVDEGKKFFHLPMTELKGWAVAFSGKSTQIDEWMNGRERLYTKQIGSNSYVVVKNDFSEGAFQSANLSGLDVSAVSPNDVCVYVTNKKKGGIDDVFK